MMRKRLQVLICATAILPCCAQPQVAKHPQPAPPQVTEPPKTLPPAGEPQSAASIDAKVVSMPGKDWYDKLAVWSTVGLVFVGAGGTIAALLSLHGIREQVGQMKAQVSIMEAQSAVLAESVNVAKRSAQATEATVETMKLAERSWLLESLNFPDRLPRQSESRGGVWVAVVKIKNVGARPALIRTAHTRFHTSTRLPDEPQYRNGAPIPDGQILAPGGEAFLRCLLEEGSFADDQLKELEEEMMPDLKLYLYGRVIYESVGTVGMNQFCYRWENLMGLSLGGDKPGFIKDGPAAYNSHT
jgi:hypothetical protein